MQSNVSLARTSVSANRLEQALRDQERLRAIFDTQANLGDKLSEHPLAAKLLGGVATKYLRASQERAHQNAPAEQASDRAQGVDGFAESEVYAANIRSSKATAEQVGAHAQNLPRPDLPKITEAPQAVGQVAEQTKEMAGV